MAAGQEVLLVTDDSAFCMQWQPIRSADPSTEPSASGELVSALQLLPKGSSNCRAGSQ